LELVKLQYFLHIWALFSTHFIRPQVTVCPHNKYS
jgi:hypothetical protein